MSCLSTVRAYAFGSTDTSHEVRPAPNEALQLIQAPFGDGEGKTNTVSIKAPLPNSVLVPLNNSNRKLRKLFTEDPRDNIEELTTTTLQPIGRCRKELKRYFAQSTMSPIHASRSIAHQIDSAQRTEARRVPREVRQIKRRRRHELWTHTARRATATIEAIPTLSAAKMVYCRRT